MFSEEKYTSTSVATFLCRDLTSHWGPSFSLHLFHVSRMLLSPGFLPHFSSLLLIFCSWVLYMHNHPINATFTGSYHLPMSLAAASQMCRSVAPAPGKPATCSINPSMEALGSQHTFGDPVCLRLRRWVLPSLTFLLTPPPHESVCPAIHWQMSHLVWSLSSFHPWLHSPSMAPTQPTLSPCPPRHVLATCPWEALFVIRKDSISFRTIQYIWNPTARHNWMAKSCMRKHSVWLTSLYIK